MQQKQKMPVWGWGDKGEKISISLGESKAEAVCGDDGKWQVKLDPPAAGGPYELVVAGSNKISLGDVLVA